MRSPGAAYLDTLLDHERSGMAEPPGLDRMRSLLRAIGDPQTRFRSIHVTGTNGKGTVSAATAGLLADRGLAVGTYTSPHVDRLTERVALQGHPVQDTDLGLALDVVRDAASSAGLAPTWFEVVTAAAFRLFAEHKIDVAVVEVGMLGRWDATNVIDADIAVVTNVELDHAELAGPRRADIAREKAGIVKLGSTLVLGERDSALRPIFTAELPARVLAIGDELGSSGRRTVPGGSVVNLATPRAEQRGVRVRGPGRHNCDNLLLAVAAAEEYLNGPLSTEDINRLGTRIRLPGRTEIVHGSPLVMLDGAHNPAALLALREAMAELPHVAGPGVLVCGALRGRDLVPALARLAKDVDSVIVCEPPSPRAMPAAHLAAALGSTQAATLVADPADALRAALATAGTDGMVVVTGSLHLLHRARTGLLPEPGSG